jgi:hypothetical protein
MTEWKYPSWGCIMLLKYMRRIRGRFSQARMQYSINCRFNMTHGEPIKKEMYGEEKIQSKGNKPRAESKKCL